MTLGKMLRLIFIIVAVIYGLFFGITLYRSFSSSVSEPIPARQITQNSLPLQEIWRKDSIHLLRAGLPTTDAVVVVANYNRSVLQYRLQGLDVTRGDALWEVLLPRRVGVDSLIAKDNRLYVAVTWEIQAYQLSDGQLLWQTPGEPPERSGYRLSWFDENLVNYSSVVGENHRLMSVYDPISGALLQQKQIPINPKPLLTTAGIEYRGRVGQVICFQQKLWTATMADAVEWQSTTLACLGGVEAIDCDFW